MNEIPAAKLKMMRTSLQCLACGLTALVPLIGIPFGLAGLWFSYTARRLEARFWNPARPQRIIGLVCASIGCLVWSIVATILIYNATHPDAGRM